MAKSQWRARLRTQARRALNYFRRELGDSELKRSAIVFAPHEDDETLGCGGTIIKKIRAGADVSLVFMTDGSGSHSHLMPKEALKSVRAREALAASQALGVAASRVFFLEFKDGELTQYQSAAVPRVAEILQRQQPDEVFVPHRKDPPPDHVATHRIVLAALIQCGRKANVYEYPIWLWQHWPWTSVPMRRRREALSILKRSLESGWLLLNEFRYAVYTGDVLELKHAALNQHKSQVTRLIPDTNWPTLSDVSSGEFLDCFFQEYEIFRRYQLPGRVETRDA